MKKKLDMCVEENEIKKDELYKIKLLWHLIWASEVEVSKFYDS